MIRVLTGGKFNRIHAGHIWLLRKAKSMGHLVIVVAHETHNRRSYALPAKQRKKNLERLHIANKVIIGNPTSFVSTVKRVRPNVIALGYDQSLPRGVETYVKKNKIAIIRFKRHGKHSTRKLHP